MIGICGLIIGNCDWIGVLWKFVINFGVGCIFLVEVFVDKCGCVVDIIIIDGVVFVVVIDCIVIVIVDNCISIINFGVVVRNVIN